MKMLSELGAQRLRVIWKSVPFKYEIFCMRAYTYNAAE